MAIKRFKPTTPTQRFKTVIRVAGIKDNEPHKSLVSGKCDSAGRNNNGRITVRRRGGGHKKKYREIDFLRDKKAIPGVVETLEYDPNRTALIALICYKDGERRYIIAPEGLKNGQTIIANDKVDNEPGNTAPIGNLPIGANIHNIEMVLGRGGQIARSAGSFATISGRDKGYTIIKMPSGEVRKINDNCIATVGIVSNGEHELLSIGKAGRNRWLGHRPKVRGVVMNPVDHPHGGGEGKTSGGRHPVTPWGKKTKGKKTRSKRKSGSNFIISRRK
ncbi:MAG: 50S ribosomal protein L2 [Spirochaetia bacterium]|nr:50S ribosomal protein L2 [Spirochaetia bacterium]